MDRLEQRVNSLEQNIINLEGEVKAIKQVLHQHGMQLNQLQASVDQLQSEQHASK